MDVVRPAFVPDPSLSRDEMEALQRDIATAASFSDDLQFDPARLCDTVDESQTTLDAAADTVTEREDAGDDSVDRSEDAGGDDSEEPLVAGVDQAFVGDLAVSAIVVLQGGDVVERAHAVEETQIPYIPGLLSFREGGAILAAFEQLDREPDIAIVDGSGRIHFREAGLATHIGVTLDLPAIGVAKSLLCGTPTQSLDSKLSTGTRVAVVADESVTAPADTVIGYAFQSRQYESGNQYINPLYVSPGHRVSAETAVDVVECCGGEYKLPEPTRLADAYADDLKAEVDE